MMYVMMTVIVHETQVDQVGLQGACKGLARGLQGACKGMGDGGWGDGVVNGGVNGVPLTDNLQCF